MLERMAKGLWWNGVDTGDLNNANTNLPIVSYLRR